MIAPSQRTLTRLLIAGGGREATCYFPGCPVPAVDTESGQLTVEVARIYGLRPEEARFDGTKTAEALAGFENLVFLCSNHHLLVDTGEGFPTDVLESWKAEAEVHDSDAVPPMESQSDPDSVQRLKQVIAAHQQNPRLSDATFHVSQGDRYVELSRKLRLLDRFEEAAVAASSALTEYRNQVGGEELVRLAQDELEKSRQGATTSSGPTSTSTTSLAHVNLPQFLPSDELGGTLLGAFENLAARADQLLLLDVWPELESGHVSEVVAHLRHQMYRNPAGHDLSILGGLGRQLGLAIAGILEGTDQRAVEIVVGNTTSDFLDASATIVEPADQLADMAAAAGNVPDGVNRYLWIESVLAGGGGAATLGTSLAVAVGASSQASGVVACVLGLFGTLAWFGLQMRSRT